MSEEYSNRLVINLNQEILFLSWKLKNPEQEDVNFCEWMECFYKPENYQLISGRLLRVNDCCKQFDCRCGAWSGVIYKDKTI